FQCHSGVARRNAMPYTQHRRDTSLELNHKRTVVGHPPPIKHVVQQRHQVFAVADIRPPDMEGFAERSHSSQNREVAWGSFHVISIVLHTTRDQTSLPSKTHIVILLRPSPRDIPPA